MGVTVSNEFTLLRIGTRTRTFRFYNIHLHYVKLVSTSQRTLSVFIIKTYLLMLFSEIDRC